MITLKHTTATVLSAAVLSAPLAALSPVFAADAAQAAQAQQTADAEEKGESTPIEPEPVETSSPSPSAEQAQKPKAVQSTAPKAVPQRADKEPEPEPQKDSQEDSRKSLDAEPAPAQEPQRADVPVSEKTAPAEEGAEAEASEPGEQEESADEADAAGISAAEATAEPSDDPSEDEDEDEDEDADLGDPQLDAPQSVEAGGTLTVTGSGVGLGSVTVTFGDASTEVQAADDGAFIASLEVPADMPVGPHTVTATGSAGQATASVMVTVEDHSPQASFSTTSPKRGESITITSTGHLPGETVTVKANRPTSAGTVTATADGSGTAVLNYPISASDPDTFVLSVHDPHMSAPFASEVITVEDADVDISIAAPDSVREGDEYTVTATGLTPGGEAVLTIGDTTRTATADEDGRVSWTLTAPQVSADRTETLRVTDETTGQSEEAAITFLDDSDDGGSGGDDGDDGGSGGDDGDDGGSGGDDGGSDGGDGGSDGDGDADPGPRPDPEPAPPEQPRDEDDQDGGGETPPRAPDDGDEGEDDSERAPEQTPTPDQEGEGDRLPDLPTFLGGDDEAPLPRERYSDGFDDDPVPQPDDDDDEDVKASGSGGGDRDYIDLIQSGPDRDGGGGSAASPVNTILGIGAAIGAAVVAGLGWLVFGFRRKKAD